MRYACWIIHSSLKNVSEYYGFHAMNMYDVLVQLAMAKDPEAAFFKKLEGLQPCEVSELKAGTHIFAVYGLNKFNAAYLSFFLGWG